MVVATGLGALAGIVTGLIPGIHVNTVAALVLASSAGCAALGIEYSALLAFTCALAISHTFFDVVPGLFLGVPGDETFALLPGHRLVKKGEGQAAIRLSVIGSVIGLALGASVIYYAPLRRMIGNMEGWVRPWMFFLLAIVALVLILSDRHKFWSLFTFLAAGCLGVAVFGSPLVAGGGDAPVNALFPSLAGMFGVAGLLFAISTAGNEAAPPPAERLPRLPWVRAAGPGVWGGAAGLLVGLLPGLGAANAATCLLLVSQWRARLIARWRGIRGAVGGELADSSPTGDPRTRDDADRAYLVTHIFAEHVRSPLRYRCPLHHWPKPQRRVDRGRADFGRQRSLDRPAFDRPKHGGCRRHRGGRPVEGGSAASRHGSAVWTSGDSTGA